MSYLSIGIAFLEDLYLLGALDVLGVLHSMRDLIIAFDAFQRGDSDTPPINIIIFARNLKHELLTMPDLSKELVLDTEY